MPISKLTKDKVVRPSLIDSIDKINEMIDVVNEVDPGADIGDRVTALETQTSDLATRLNNVSAELASIMTTLSAQQTDITNIKATLYTPLSQEV